ncbi:putative secreted protein (Por secretion system target) [Ichthyenterobacterium magnum]|uniref:Putative secreted protein (Por secretion system target) n=2 Tax=Ichthyenterobacterium magnum TaxID=1230530 RepID=A0A420DWE5_9FLAO|nr:putative secreted protein (Por secretion system target) [Ichthyenterobacterium magnum]
MGFSQTKDSSFTIASSTNSSNIEGLSIFPNPVTNGKLYITTKNNLTKDIEIFDVLGKKVFTASLFDKELNISKLTSGVYILKIKENNITATRKLVIR